MILASVKSADGTGELYATGLNNGLYRSRDGARTFEKVSPDKISFARGVAFGKSAPNSKNPTMYFAGTINGRDGVFFEF